MLRMSDGDYAFVQNWIAGSIWGASWENVAILAVGLALLVAGALYASRTLNVLGLGEAAATGLGVNVPRPRAAPLTAVAVGASGLACAVGGGLTFVGLVCPHMARRLVGPNFRVLVPACVLVGAVLMLLADIIARSLFNEIPVGIVAAVIGCLLAGNPGRRYLLKKNAADFARSSWMLPGASSWRKIRSARLAIAPRALCRAALRGEAVSVGYGDRVIIKPMDVAVPARGDHLIIGPNGCRKSTLLKALSRTMPLRGGAVYLNGTAIATMPTAEVARQMALLPQSPQAPAGLTVGELVALGRYPHQKGFGRLTDDDRSIIDWALSITHLDGLVERPHRRAFRRPAPAGLDRHGARPGHRPHPSGRAHHLSGHGPPAGGAGTAANAQPRRGQDHFAARPSRRVQRTSRTG